MHVLHAILWIVLMYDTDYAREAVDWETSSACSQGYYGTDCGIKCPINCLNNKCHMNGTCNTCNRGFHGPNCSKPCSSACYYNTCEMNGTCVPCIAGFYGKECNMQCHENCLTCFSKTQCGQCTAGYYGEDCRSSCPSNCINCTNKGYCGICKPGYRGNTCNETCSLCKAGTACRKSDGYCLEACKDGYTSENCTQKCHPNCRTCIRNRTTSCTECAKGRFGFWNTAQYDLHESNCLEKCPVNCLHGLCNERTGQCLNCTGNFQGDRCDKCREPLANSGKQCKCRTDLCLYNLKSNCHSCSNSSWYPDRLSHTCCPCSNTCRNNTCSKQDVCTHGCVDGYYGEECRNKCSDKQTRCEKCSIDYHKGYMYICDKCSSGFYPTKNECTPCSDYCLNGKCDPTDGRCTDGCIEGRWGETCSLKCEKFCNDGICDRNSGHCTAGCVSDHWGETCNGTCVQHCEVCENEIECIRCEPGRYLSNCSGQCSKGCAKIEGNIVCDINDGSCRDGCLNERFRGKQCVFDCSDNCTWSECDMLTGKCRRGCEKGLYGEFCNSTCADTCMPAQHGTACFDTNGTCIAGCMNGYYGDTCRDECHKNCVNGTCNQDSGSCLFGCLPCHLGANCSIAMNKTLSIETVNMTWIIVLAVVNIILIAAIFCIVLVFKRTGHSAVSTYLTPISGNGTSRERQPDGAIAVIGHSAASTYRTVVNNDTEASKEKQYDGVIVGNDNQANEEIVGHYSEAISGHVYVEMDEPGDIESHTNQDHQPLDAIEDTTGRPHRCDVEESTYEPIGLQKHVSVETTYESID